MHQEWRREEFTISTDPARLDLGVVHGYLTRSYWAAGIPLEVVRRSIGQSLNFGLYRGDRQVGFARVVTDRATFAWLCDVFVLEEEQGQGLGKWLVQTVLSHPELQGLRRWILATRDAHGLYARNGFVPLPRPERWMVIHDPEVYRRKDAGSKGA
jgi:GNAT superfamily N-acetyltransferase